jgi:hypothetical protein
MSDDFGSGDGGLDGGGGGLGGAGGVPYGYDNAAAHLRTVDAQRPIPHENPGARDATRLPKLAGAIVLILAIAWAVRVFWPA